MLLSLDSQPHPKASFQSKTALCLNHISQLSNHNLTLNLTPSTNVMPNYIWSFSNPIPNPNLQVNPKLNFKRCPNPNPSSLRVPFHPFSLSLTICATPTPCSSHSSQLIIPPPFFHSLFPPLTPSNCPHQTLSPFSSSHFLLTYMTLPFPTYRIFTAECSLIIGHQVTWTCGT